jgi:LacI family transcriptional regulator
MPTPDRSRPTLRTIAEQAGVSHTTVSLALRNSPLILPETRKRVLAIADELGYRPDPMVGKVMSTLRFASPGSRTLAYITKQASDPDWINHRTYGSWYRGASTRVSQVGYNLDVFPLDDPSMTGRRLERILYHRGIRGCIFAPMTTPMAHLNFDLEQLSSVVLGQGLKRPMLNRISNNQSQTLLIAARMLRRRGSRRVGVLLPGDGNKLADYQWTSGLAIFHELIPRSQRIPLLQIPGWDRRVFMKWFEKYRPDAIAGLGTNFMPWLEKKGLRVPEDIQVAVLDRSENENFAGVDQHHDLAGAAAVDALLGAMYFGEMGIPAVSRAILIASTWVEGGSVRPPPQGFPARSLAP